MTTTDAKTGGCLCGAVRFSAAETGQYGICHCEQCRRFFGSALFGVMVPRAAMTLEGAENVGVIHSSSWATRSWCTKCGSPLWYRADPTGGEDGDYEVAIGLFDAPQGFAPIHWELYADEAAQGVHLAGDHRRLTRAETLARFQTTES